MYAGPPQLRRTMGARQQEREEVLMSIVGGLDVHDGRSRSTMWTR
jgi:hypothetical protein